MSEKVDFHGIPMTIVSDKECEQCDYMVCVPWGTPSPFEDNLKGICCKCGIDVMYRWYAPRKPKRICLQCVVIVSEESKDGLE